MSKHTSDVTVALGIVCLIVGAALVHPSLAWLVAGLAVTAYGALLGLSKPSR